MIRWMLLLGLLLVGCGMGPTTYPGDRVEERACRWCGGTGEAGQMQEGGPVSDGPCPGCRGAKKLKVVVPGPNHPAVVKGTVRDLAALGDIAGNPDAIALMTMQEGQNPGPVTGAVPNATVVFEGSDKVTYAVPATGRIKTMLKPGHYKVTITAPGFAEGHQEIDVAQRREPIWSERARLVTEEQEADTTYVDFTLRR